jgi:DNA-binding MarR family transcriptional regulator
MVDNVNHHRRRPQDEVLDLVHSVMHQVRAQQYRVLRGGGHDITHMESKVLIYLARHPEATQRDMARDTGRDKAQLARLIKGLRERGLLSSQADPADRRNLRLSLTAEGKSVLQKLEQQSTRLASKAVAAMNAAEVRQLLIGRGRARPDDSRCADQLAVAPGRCAAPAAQRPACTIPASVRMAPAWVAYSAPGIMRSKCGSPPNT